MLVYGIWYIIYLMDGEFILFQYKLLATILWANSKNFHRSRDKLLLRKNGFSVNIIYYRYTGFYI